MTAGSAPLLAEVVAALGSVILDVRHVGADGDLRPWSGLCRRYVLGQGPRAMFPLAVEGAGEDGCFTLVEARAGRLWLHLPPGAEALRVDGEARAPASAGELTPGAAIHVTLGAVRFEIRTVAAEPVPKFRASLDRPLWLAQATSLLLCLGVAVFVRSLGPAAPPTWDDPALQERLIRYTAASPAREPAPPVQSPARPVAPAPGGERSTDAPASESASADAPRTALISPPSGQDPGDMAERAGFLGLAEFDRIVGDYTRALEESARHYLVDAADDAAWRSTLRAVPEAIAGLGLGDTQRGGGGEARGVVDLPVKLLATVDASGKKRHAGHGRRESAFVGRPEVASEAATPRQNVEWTASIGRDLIRGVVRRNTPEVRRCFHEATQRDPELRGKLEVAFTIAEGGRVAAVAIAESSVHDREVERCVEAAVKRWTFPTIVAAAGDVAVRYPFTVGAA